MLSIRYITSIDEFGQLRESWTKLYQISEIKTTFLTWEWLFTWWEFFGERKKLRLITVWRDGQLSGIAPLMLTSKYKWGFKLKLLTQIGYQDTDISGFVIEKGDEKTLSALCTAINQLAGEWQIFELLETPSDNINQILKKEVISNSSNYVRVEETSHLFIPINTDWDQFYSSQSKHLRRDIKRKILFVENRNKKINIHRYYGNSVTKSHIEEIFRINKFGNFSESYERKIQKEFHFRLFERMKDNRWIEISFLDIGDSPIAFRYGFNNNSTYEDWRTGFDTRFKEYSPGVLVAFFLFRDLVQSGFIGIDLLRGDEEHKRRWKVEEKKYSHLLITHRKDILTDLLMVWAPALKKQIPTFLNGRNVVRNKKE